MILKGRLAIALTGIAALAMTSCQSVTLPEISGADSADPVDLLIVGGTLYDGTGGPAVTGDIAIQGTRIFAMGAAGTLNVTAARTLHAEGRIVAPGFIDPHTHADSDLRSDDASRRANLPYLMQGVTTVMVGNDGFGSSEVGAMSSAAMEQGIGTNAAYLVGLGYIRKAVIGEANRAPDPAELAQMQHRVRSAMCAGAVGFSGGLYYTPQNFAATDEVAILARVAAKFGGYYDTHVRDESDYSIGVEAALAEAIRIGREAGVPVHISHIKALGPSVWGKSAAMIETVERARADGLTVTADQYPWTASGTRISNALVPRWALDGGLDGLRGRFASTDMFARIKHEMAQNLVRRGGPDKLLITGQLGGADVTAGQTLAQIAEAEHVEPLDAAIAILRVGDARVASFVMDADDIRAFAKQDWVMTGSDGSNGHPRKYATYPKAYRDFVVDNPIMSLARFIRRSSGQVADMAGLKERGYLKLGYFADVLVFDPSEFAPVADYQNPRGLSKGVEYLLVNGAIVVDKGAYNGKLPGTALLKHSAAQISICRQPRR